MPRATTKIDRSTGCCWSRFTTFSRHCSHSVYSRCNSREISGRSRKRHEILVDATSRQPCSLATAFTAGKNSAACESPMRATVFVPLGSPNQQSDLGWVGAVPSRQPSRAISSSSSRALISDGRTSAGNLVMGSGVGAGVGGSVGGWVGPSVGDWLPVGPPVGVPPAPGELVGTVGESLGSGEYQG